MAIQVFFLYHLTFHFIDPIIVTYIVRFKWLLFLFYFLNYWFFLFLMFFFCKLHHHSEKLRYFGITSECLARCEQYNFYFKLIIIQPWELWDCNESLSCIWVILIDFHGFLMDNLFIITHFDFGKLIAKWVGIVWALVFSFFLFWHFSFNLN